MDQIFNELSLSGAHSDKYEALKAMHGVFQASLFLEKLGFNGSIRTTKDFFQRELARGYTCNDWILDKNATAQFKDLLSFMLTKCSKSPYVENLCQVSGMTELEEYRFDENITCLGLALAHIWGIPVLSLAGDIRFTNDEISFFRNAMDENGNINSETCCVLRLSRKEDAAKHKDKIRSCLFPDILNGLDLLDLAETAFPHLAFCGNAPAQLKNMDGNEIYFQKIIRILRALDEAMRLVDGPGTEFAPQEIRYIARESDSTMQRPRTRGERIFLCPDGKTRMFVEHVRISKALRVYLFSDRAQRKVYIGHVGTHLQTALF